jgi:hypothetical protein
VRWARNIAHTKEKQKSVDHFWDINLKNKGHLGSQEVNDTDINVNPEGT